MLHLKLPWPLLLGYSLDGGLIGPDLLDEPLYILALIDSVIIDRVPGRGELALLVPVTEGKSCDAEHLGGLFDAYKPG